MAKIPKITNSFFNTKFGNFIANPRATAATAAAIATVSNVSKDAVNCYYYVHQSLHNERIPEEQRKFVGALDLSNGLLNVGLQILMSFGISDAIVSLFDNKIAKSKEFDISEKTIQEKFAKLPEKLKATTNLEEFRKGFIQHTKGKTSMARLGFTVLTVNIAMQILTKRILTPLIATPLASVFKRKFENADNKTKENEQNKQLKEVA